MTIKKINLKALKRRLPSGWTLLVVEALQKKGLTISGSLASMVINGKRTNIAVLEAIIEVAEEYEAKLDDLSRRARSRKAA